MTTLIGTPPNLIVAGFRQQQGMGSFAMFDFTAVGLSVAVVGVLFIAFIGWRLVPVRKQAGMEGFDTGAYLTEVRVPEGSASVGQTLHALELALDKAGAQVVGLVRNDIRVIAPSPYRQVVAGDILVMKPKPMPCPSCSPPWSCGWKNRGDRKTPCPRTTLRTPTRQHRHDPGIAEPAADTKSPEEETAPTSSDIVLMELAILPSSGLEGRSASDLLLRTRYGLNLLAVSRQGQRSRTRLRAMPLQAGDLLLMQGPLETIAEFASDSGCVPLANAAAHPQPAQGLAGRRHHAAFVGGRRRPGLASGGHCLRTGRAGINGFTHGIATCGL